MEYRVKWLNYPSAENSWEPAEELMVNCREKIENFETLLVERKPEKIVKKRVRNNVVNVYFYEC